MAASRHCPTQRQLLRDGYNYSKTTTLALCFKEPHASLIFDNAPPPVRASKPLAKLRRTVSECPNVDVQAVAVAVEIAVAFFVEVSGCAGASVKAVEDVHDMPLSSSQGEVADARKTSSTLRSSG